MPKLSILVVNDDGIYAPGIRALADGLEDIADVTVVAPLVERSTTGHALTLDHPLRLVQIKERRYGCSGYPADCVLMALGHVLQDRKPDLVISGINRGGNLGQDVYCSGTVAAAREAAFRGCPSIAISLVTDVFGRDCPDDHFSSAVHVAQSLVLAGIASHINPFTVINVNVPNDPVNKIDPNIKLVELGFKKYSDEITKRMDSRGKPYFWVGGHWEEAKSHPGSDCYAVTNGHVSFTPLNLLHQKDDNRIDWQGFINTVELDGFALVSSDIGSKPML